jgi:hypothetical protein
MSSDTVLITNSIHTAFIKYPEGDGGALIPLPSQLTDKVPKLLGAKFTTRNGAIIISTKNSRRADAVLAPN